ncbi:MAG TPA: ABC transporter ATP-binding protein [Verrucomicrobiae bacterium]|nr:ABC transporter ATP-binding protein [Verrucomicrobiae bacterium]
MPRLAVSELKKVYRARNGDGVVALNGLSFEVGDGELLVMAGPSGCGKTTTLRLIAGLEQPCSGSIALDGQPMNGLKPHERDVAMVFQSDALLPHLSAYENMALGLRLRRVDKAESNRRVEEAAALLEIAGLLKRFPGELSGGERRRVALGRAIVRRPKLFLLDEPLANLDAELRVRMRQLIQRVHKELRATMIMVTHELADAQNVRTIILERGQPVRVS